MTCNGGDRRELVPLQKGNGDSPTPLKGDFIDILHGLAPTVRSLWQCLRLLLLIEVFDYLIDIL